MTAFDHFVTELTKSRDQAVADNLKLSGKGPACIIALALDEVLVAARTAQAIEARSGETERLDPKGESAVHNVDAPNA